jgi:hypothetical protein
LTFEHRQGTITPVSDPDSTERRAARSIIVRLPDEMQERLQRACESEACDPEEWVIMAIANRLAWKETT